MNKMGVLSGLKGRVVLSAVVSFIVLTSAAETVTWTGSASSDWSTAANWTSGSGAKLPSTAWRRVRVPAKGEVSVGLGERPSARLFDVRAFGAQGDGVAKDTAAIQAAIDAAEEAGGGEVFLGSGTYLSGTIYLKDGIDFHLGAGATLLGSPDREDYCPCDISPFNRGCRSESSFGAHLVVCCERKNVTVRGPGRIDGHAKAFLLSHEGKVYGQASIPWRPSQMLWFAQCEDVRVTDLNLVNSTYWSCLFHGCDRVWVRGCRVRNNRFDRGTFHTHNGDGFDVDCCHSVSISDCDIDVADDSITLRADPVGPMRNRDCGWVTVSNCRLSSACNAVRLGVGTGKIHDAVFSNLTVRDTSIAFNFVSSWSPKTRGSDFENIRFENCTVECERFCCLYHNYARDTAFDGLVFSGIGGKSLLPGTVMANAAKPFGRILFKDVDLDCGVFLHNAPRATIEGGRLRALEPTADDLKNGEQTGHPLTPWGDCNYVPTTER